ncbi:DUF6011 domain-containing protein [Catenuloplanes indicus]|uniref:Uncharacterized protein n=1 Tax=Catenuloplanes indicus TaxID=137267 RepID=A0AAE4B1L8_9ACTN|nr:DUF6011 domain-containing protein [Catenuloplanes indicus]MDQ0371580.1 hypothetical protein [Catenuloplanes indicus]
MTALIAAATVSPVPCRGGCGQQLTDADSIRVGYGPDCAEKRGIWHPRHQTTTRPAARQDGPTLLDLIGDRMTDDETRRAPAESNAGGSTTLSAYPSSPERRSGDLSGPDASPLTADQAAQIAAALKSGAARICRTRCYPCQFDDCPDGPHTWMDADEIAHVGRRVDTAEERLALARTNPCGCACMDQHRIPKETP